MASPAVSPKKSEAISEPKSAASIGWTPARIRTAENQANGGYFSLAADLCEYMMCDDRVSAAIDRLYAATSLPLTFQLPGKDSESSQKDPVVQALDTDFWKMLPEEVMREMVAWLTLMRIALLHIDDWQIDSDTGRAVARISVWSPKFVRPGKRQGTWLVRTAAAGNEWVTHEDQIYPGDGRWIVVVMGSSWRAVMKAPWRGLSRPWLLKQLAFADWGDSSERHGAGVTKAENLHAGQKLTDLQRKKLANDIASLARNGTIVMPDGWSLDLVVDVANSWTTFRGQIDAANTAISIGLLGTNLTTEVKSGSFAAASVHESVDAQKMRGLLEFMSSSLRGQFLIWWVLYNFGAKSIAPYPHWETKPPQNLTAEAETHSKAATAYKTYVDAGLPVDPEKWSEKFGVPITGKSNAS
jgi:Protein of unknown function (DUF935)